MTRDVERFASARHGVEDDKELSRAGGQSDFAWFAGGKKALIVPSSGTSASKVVMVALPTPLTLQIKGSNVTTAPAGPADVALTRRYIVLLAEELRPLGWSADYVHDVFWHDPVHLVALHFTPEGAFQQTPGPGAGAALCLEPGASR